MLPIRSKQMFLRCFFLTGTLASALPAHSSAVITGVMANAYVNDRIELRVPQYYINYKSNTFRAFIDEQQRFTIRAEVPEPQLVFLIHNEDRLVLFLEPDDSLHLESDVLQFPLVVSHSGRAGHNNHLLRQFLQENPVEMNEFNKMKYRIGPLWANVDVNMDRNMQELGPEAFKAMLEQRKVAGLGLLDAYRTENPGGVTPAFSNFLSAEILYYQAYHLLFYGAIYKTMHGLEPAFFEFLYETPFQCDMVGSDAYRQFIMALMAYKYRETGSTDNAWSAQLLLSEDLLQDKARAFYQSEVIRLALGAERYGEILPFYTRYLQQNPYQAYDEKITDLYEKSIRVSPGVMAPGFSGKDYNGNDVSLDSLRGKTVYLNFWASWCSACLKKMELMSPYVYDLGKKNVVVINVSIDSPDDWYRSLGAHYYQGVNLLSPTEPENSIASKYGVLAVPQYFIIDRYGTFAEKPTANSVAELVEWLGR